MNTSIKTILAVVAIGATAIAAQAQTTSVGKAATPSAVTIDLEKALAGYYRTTEENTKLQAFEQGANTQAQGIIAEGKAIGEKFQAAQATFQSPVATDIAKQQAQADAQRIYADLQKKQAEFEDFRQKAAQQYQQSLLQVRQQLVGDIINKATEIGKSKGANMVLNRGALVFADTGMDITDEVLAQLNKGHPMPVVTGTGAAPSVGFNPAQ